MRKSGASAKSKAEGKASPRAGTWGGARPGAGRPKSSTRVAHRPRARVSRHVPSHVTLRVVEGLPSLRGREALRAIREALGRAQAESGTEGPRVVEYLVQANQLHLVVKANSARALARGVQGLTIRIARNLNRALARSGRVFGDRYEARAFVPPLVASDRLQRRVRRR